VNASGLSYSAIGAAATRTSSGSMTVNYPSGTNTNDLLLLIMVNGANQANGGPASGWTPLADLATSSPSQYHVTLWWKLAGASETSVSASVNTNSAGASAWVIRYVRAAGYPPNPTSATATVQSGLASATSTLTPTSVTTNGSDATVISLATVRAANTLSLSTAQSFALRTATASTPTGGVGAALGIADVAVPTSGTSPTAPTWSQSGTAAQWAWATVAFK
jgi:hypothetical protein